MRRYEHRPREDRPRHQPGEVVLGMSGNWLEDRHARGKVRPWVIVQAGGGQHLAVGLTTQPRYQTSGGQRPEVPHDAGSGLDGDRSYLWSSRPVHLSRASVHKHLGWASRGMVEMIGRHTHIAPHVIDHLRHLADLADDHTEGHDA